MLPKRKHARGRNVGADVRMRCLKDGKTSYVICSAQCKMKIWEPCLKEN